MERLVAPMDFNLPFSRARWVADTGMILASPTPPMAADGREPLAGVARESTGNLYGTAAYGGIGIVLFSVE